MRAMLLAAAAALPCAATAATTGLEQPWAELSMRRCAEPMLAQAGLGTDGLSPLPEAEAMMVDFRSAGRVWRGTGPLLLIHMEHAAGAEVYAGCRVDFAGRAEGGPPLDVPAAISAFEAWVAASLDSRRFADVTCVQGPRLYARRIRTAAEVRPGVHVAIVVEAGVGGSFLFFAAVEEPVGAGGCPAGG